MNDWTNTFRRCGLAKRAELLAHNFSGAVKFFLGLTAPLVVALGLSFATIGASQAQTGNDADEQSDTVDVENSAPKSLEQKYQEELDKWMLQAYEGNRDAQFKVGALFTNEQFNGADYEQAVYWYKQAARQGHTLSQYNLGHHYITGTGVKRNEPEAMKWWLKAAEHDHPLAQFNIGRAYYLGIGLEEDHSQSKYWFRRAAQNREPKSIEILEQLGWADPGEFKSGPEQAFVARADAGDLPESSASPNEPSAPSKEPSEGQDPASATQDELSAVDKEPTTQPDAPAQEQQANLNEEPVESTKPSTDDAASSDTASTPELRSIAAYTDPAKRSVLISILDAQESLEIISESEDWTIVSSKLGLPVWIHQNYVVVNNDTGVIKGNSVNARAVPIIASVTIVVKLNDGEILEVLGRKNQWYRLMSPARFQAWVKTDDLVKQSNEGGADNTSANADAQPEENLEGYDITGDDAWLFSRPQNTYTLQLASFDDPQKVAEFIAGGNFENNPDLHRFTSRAKDIEWTYFLYGEYESDEAARAAREEIGQKLAWARSFGRLQQNRCIAWKKQIPAPKALNRYCSQ